LLVAFVATWLVLACALVGSSNEARQEPVEAQTERPETQPASGPAPQSQPATGPAPQTQPAKEEVTVTVFATGDLHEHTSYFARIAGYVKAAKEDDPNVLLMDAGDMCGGYGEQAMGVTRGEAMFALISAMGYDACILGNWDYGMGKDRILELCGKFPKFPLLMANVQWGEEDEESAKLIPPYRIFELEGVKVAVVGTGSHDMRYARRKRFAIYYEVDAVHIFVPELRKQADIVIAVTHQYEKHDYKAASGPNAPDLIVGGHSHGAYTHAYGREKKSFIVKSGPYGRRLGVVKITWDGEKITGIEGELLRIGDDWPVDEEVKSIREKYMKAWEESKAAKAAEKKKAAAAEPASK
jgi:2',3'-cyclic-nucleotide 2'-phosphodiesterase (5'-nucleotidase family)